MLNGIEKRRLKFKKYSYLIVRWSVVNVVMIVMTIWITILESTHD